MGDLRTEATHAIRDAILQGRLKPGERLTENRLCDQLGISRPPLREAIRSLESDGLVESIARHGAFVRVLTGRDVEEIYAVRCALEGLAAELCIETATDKEIDELEQLVLELETKDHDTLHGTIAVDIDFHRKLVTLSKNRTLIQMWNTLMSQLHLALTLVDPSFYGSDYIEETHHALVTAMRERQPQAAWGLIRSLRKVGRNLSERWDEVARVTQENN